MKTTSILFTCFAAFAIQTAQAQLQYHLPRATYSEWKVSDQNLQGQVKEMKFYLNDVIQSEWHYNENQLLITGNTYENPDKILHGYAYTYDEENHLSQLVFTDQDGKKTQYKFVYDKQGRLSEKNFMNGQKQAAWEYDGNGNVTRVSSFYEGSISSFNTIKYDEQGRISEMTDFKCIMKHNCDFSGSEIYTYDANGNLVSKKSSGVFAGSEQHTYDKQNRLIKSESIISAFGGKGDQKPFITTYKYDENNRVIEKAYNDGKTVEQYEYDAHGNWIKETITDQKNTSVVTRHISYYN